MKVEVSERDCGPDDVRTLFVNRMAACVIREHDFKYSTICETNPFFLQLYLTFIHFIYKDVGMSPTIVSLVTNPCVFTPCLHRMRCGVMQRD